MVDQQTNGDGPNSLWKSRPAKILYTLFGLPAVVLLGWYFYTVAFEFQKEEMTQMERKVAKKAKSIAKGASELAKRAVKEGFETEEVDNCRNVVKQYETPQGWVMTDARLNELVGLPATASKAQMNERCVYFAKVVAAMQRISHHSRHVFVCGKSFFEIAGGKNYYIRSDPQGRGAIQNLSNNKDQLIPIQPGRTTVFNHWQLFNVGDGCIVVGLSKAGTFRMSGKVVRKE